MSNCKPRTLTFRTTRLLDTGGAWLTCKHTNTINNIYCLYMNSQSFPQDLNYHSISTLCKQTAYSFFLNSVSEFPKTRRRGSWFCCKSHSFQMIWLLLFMHSPDHTVWQLANLYHWHYVTERAKYHWQWIQYELNNITQHQNILYPGDHNRCSAMGKGRGSFYFSCPSQKRHVFWGEGCHYYSANSSQGRKHGSDLIGFLKQPSLYFLMVFSSCAA